MKRLSACLLIVTMLLSALTACSDTTGNDISEEPKPTPNPESDFEYTISETGEFSIINGYKGTSANVVIPEHLGGVEVRIIDDFTFENSEIESVYLPDTLTIILSSAFQNCKNLKSVRFGNNITRIEDRAFRDCVALEKAELPDDLEKIGESAFENCTSLKKVVFPGRDIKFAMSIFMNCSSLSEVVFEEGIETITEGYAMFGNTALKEVTVPASVKTLYAYTFFGCVDRITFLGDAPELKGNVFFKDSTTVYYDPSTSGWDTTKLKDMYTLLPIE